MIKVHRFNKTKIAALISLSIGLTACGDNDTNIAKTTAADQLASNVAATTKPSQKVTQGTVKGQVAIGNVEGASAYTTGVTIRATLITDASYTASGHQAQAASEGDAEQGVFITTTDSTGTFSLALPEGFYSIEAQGGVTRKAIAQVQVAAESTQSLDFVLTATGSILGSVAPEEDEGGNYQGRLVYIPGTSYMARTNREGNFVISNIPVGDYSVVYKDLITGEGVNISVKVAPGENELGEANPSQPPAVVDAYLQSEQMSPSSFEQANQFAIVRFSHPMDVEATEAAISLDNAAIGELSFNWWNNNRYLEVSLKSTEAVYGDASLIVSTAAKNEAGLSLSEAIYLDFRLTEFIRWSNASDGEDVYLGNADHGLLLSFSSEINKASVGITLEPTLEGLRYEWHRDGTVVEILGNYQLGTQYVVSVNSAETVSQQTLSDLPYSLAVNSTQAKVTYSSITNGTVEVDPLTSVKIGFNSPLNRDSLEQAVVVNKVLANGTLTPLPADDFDIVWLNNAYNDWESYDEYYGINSTDTRENFTVAFHKEVATKYQISIDLATAKTLDNTLMGAAGETYNLAFTTLIPRMLSSSPENNGMLYGNNLSLDFNVDLQLADAEFTLVAEDGTVISDIDINDNYGELYVELPPLAPATAYTLSYTGIKSGDSAIDDGQIKFVTDQAHISYSQPYGQRTNVNLDHRVTLDFSVVVPEKQRDALEAALVIEPLSESRAISYIWDTDNSGKSRLYINFTFEPSTNYVLAFPTDAADNILINDSADAELNTDINTGIKQYQPLSFSTVSQSQIAQGLSNVSTIILNGNYYNEGTKVTLAPGDANINIAFNQLSRLDTGDLVLVDQSGAELAIELQDEWGNDLNNNCYKYQNNQCYTPELYIQLPDLAANSQYTVKLKDIKQFDIATYCNENPNSSTYSDNWNYRQCSDLLENGWSTYVDQFPLTVVEFTTSAPYSYHNIDNVNGLFELGTTGGYYFSTAELASISFDPGLEILNRSSADQAEVDTITKDTYVDGEYLVYRPEPFANIQVNIPALTVYQRNVGIDATVVSFTPLKNTVGENVTFENTDESFVDNVAPNFTQPELKAVSAKSVNNIELFFNTKLDAELAREPSNYQLACVTGDNEAVTFEVLATSISEESYSTARSFNLTTAELPLTNDTQCTVTINNLTDFGGDYPIAADSQGSFESYKGAITEVSYIEPQIDWDGTNYQYSQYVLVAADVAFDENTMDTMISYRMTNYSALAETEVTLESSQLSDDHQAIMYKFTWQSPDYDNGYFELNYSDELLNSQGGDMALSVNQSEQYHQYNGESSSDQYSYLYQQQEGSDPLGLNGAPFILLTTYGEDYNHDSAARTSNYTVYQGDGLTVGPVVESAEVQADGTIKLTLSAALDNYTYYNIENSVVRNDTSAFARYGFKLEKWTYMTDFYVQPVTSGATGGSN